MSDPGQNWAHPPPRPRASAAEIVVRVIGGVIGAGALLVALFGVFMVVSEQFDPSPEGLAMVFGAVFAFCAGLVAVVSLPFALPRGYWLRGFAATAITFVLVFALLIVTGKVAGRDDGTWRPRPGMPSLRPAFGIRVTDGQLRIWTGSRCVGVTRVGVGFAPKTASLLLDAPAGHRVEFEYLTVGGPYPAGLQVTEPFPADLDWRSEKTLTFWVNAEQGGGSTADLAEAINGSDEHPADTYWFHRVGWLNPAEVAAQDGTTFLATCTPDPKHPH